MEEAQHRSVSQPVRRRAVFARDTQGFRKTLDERVARYFSTAGRRTTGDWRMYLKTVMLFGWAIGSYWALVVVASSWWTGALAAVSLAFSIAGLGFSVMHDANHGSYSRDRRVNQVLERTLDLLGASSYLWRWKHNVFHHTYTNIVGDDHDIDLAPFARLSPTQPRRPLHRFQHLYMWVLYGFTVFHMHFVEDFYNVKTGRVGHHHFPRPRGMRLAEVYLSKLVVLGWGVVLPLFFHAWWVVLLFYAAVWFSVGLILGVVFQIAHCLDDSEFPLPDPESRRMDNAFAIHQVRTTVDFAPTNHALTWYIGALNFQVEHHLFPNICHVHYPALSPIVREVCDEFGVPYRANASFRAAVGSHYRLLRRMGDPNGEIPIEPALDPAGA